MEEGNLFAIMEGEEPEVITLRKWPQLVAIAASHLHVTTPSSSGMNVSQLAGRYFEPIKLYLGTKHLKDSSAVGVTSITFNS